MVGNLYVTELGEFGMSQLFVIGQLFLYSYTGKTRYFSFVFVFDLVFLLVLGEFWCCV